MRFLFSFGLLLLSHFSLQAQLQELLISHNPHIAKAAVDQPAKPAIPRNQKAAALPFFDDFAYNGPFPDASLWMDNQVFINNTLINEPVSIGVATFDGLDASGSPYGGYGSADTLTSIPLDLTGDASKSISYYVQPKGLGDAPGMADSLVLEFKNSIGQWNTVKSHTVTIEEAFFPSDSIPDFQFVGPIRIDDPQYLHDDFQFRFRNYALRVGAADLWHVDYIRLEEGEMSQSNTDLAFTKLPSNILQDYSSAPWTHIQDRVLNDQSLILTTVDVNVFNHSINDLSVTDSRYVITGMNLGETREFRNRALLDVSIDTKQGNVPSGPHLFTNPIRGEYASQYSNNFTTSDRIQVEVDYNFTQSAADPPGTERNNQVSRIFDLDNYYAYDDNSAESAYFVGTGGQVAVKFTNYKEDLLQAIRMQIPRIVGSDISQTFFTLKVWVGDLDSEPVYEAPLTKPLFIDEFVDSLQAFTTYVLKDPFTDEPTPITLPVGDFYIGWQQASTCNNVTCLPVGFDRNTPAATSNIFVDVDNSWRTIGSFFASGEAPVSQQGALMIRPVVGNEAPNDSETVSTTELALPQIMNIYPNPTSGMVNIQLFEGNYEDYQIRIFNTLGQQLTNQTLNAEIDLINQQSGIYFLHFLHKQTLATAKYKLILSK